MGSAEIGIEKKSLINSGPVQKKELTYLQKYRTFDDMRMMLMNLLDVCH